MNITDGKRQINTPTYFGSRTSADDLRRVYDRLRKRSWRRYQRAIGAGGYYPILVTRHEKYVDGVRDALNALVEQQDNLI